MEQNIIIYIGIWKALSLIAAVVAGTWYAAYRLGRVETTAEGFDDRLKALEGRLDNAFAAAPISNAPQTTTLPPTKPPRR
jgi:hypothetical protein